jgi:hypothetical protein
LDPGGARCGRERNDRFLSIALDDVEPRAASGQLALQRGQRLSEPPFRCAAERPTPPPFSSWTYEERRTISDGVNGGLVTEAEIAAPPDDIDACAHEPSPASR